MEMRVWWNSPFGSQHTFYHKVDNVEQALLVYRTLANYDLFTADKGIRGDFANAGGLEVLPDGETEWEEWTSDDGYDIGEVDRGMNV